MGGITSSVGIFSGINSAQLIEQLLAIEGRPKAQAQSRLAQIQLQQSSYLDINSRITAIKNASAGFREAKTFQTKSATSTKPELLSASADTTAVPGSYTFLVDRLVSTQQGLSRGFANKDVSAVGASTISFESVQARLDRDVELADLNDGRGVARGKIVVTDSVGRAATVDLSRATTVNEVLEAINSNGTASVTASVSGGKFVLRDSAGGAATVANAQGSTAATGLGLAGVAAVSGTITGNSVYQMSGATTLASLNDGNGISVKRSTTEDSYSFIINVSSGGAPTAVKINLGDVWTTTAGVTAKTEGSVADMNGVITRINKAMDAAGFTTVRGSVDSGNNRLMIVDSSVTKTLSVTEGTDSTAADLGLSFSASGSALFGKSIQAGLQTTLVRGLRGSTAGATDGQVDFRLHDGSTFTSYLDTEGSVLDMLARLEEDSKVGGVKQISATLNERGTGIQVTDLTSGGSTLRITGTTGLDTATALGISTGASGVAGQGVTGTNAQRKYISRATSLNTLNGGKSVGTGEFRITDSAGTSANINISDSVTTVGELIDLINSRGLKVRAEVNANGDGVVIGESLTGGETAGLQKIKVEDVGGTIAKKLNLVGVASGTGLLNKVDGSLERTVTLGATDTLQQVMDKINNAKAGVNATIVRDGSGSTPFRLSFTGTQSGSQGRFITDSGAFDFGVTTLDKGRDARVFFGSSDAATGVAVSSSTNTIDNILAGVKIDLKSTSADPVSLTIASNTEGIEKSIQTFLTTFNTAIERIELQTKYDAESKRKSPLLGDGTVLELRSQLFQTVQGSASGSSGAFSNLAAVGITVGAGGKLVLDSTRLRQSLATDAASVESLFTARVAVDDKVTDLGDGVTVRNPNSGNAFSSQGVVSKLEQLAKRYVDGTSAILTSRQNDLRAQVTLQQNRIVAFDSRLQDKRAALQTKFIAMEKAIGQLQTQQNALNSLPRAG